MFDNNKIITILTAYKRNYFQQQIESLKSQTVKIDKIIILQNEKHIDLTCIKETFPDIYIISSDYNTKYWGRYAIASICNTEYILMMDDDIIPGKQWIENCFRMNQTENCIVCGNGRDINNIEAIGDSGRVDKDTQMAFGGHSWFFRKEWVKYILNEKPVSLYTGEDIAFCALSKIHGGITTWIPEQHGETSSHKENYSGDQHASFRTGNWDEARKNICKYYVNKGWKL